MRYLLTILCIVALAACTPTTKKQEDKGNYFEGFVEFKNLYGETDSDNLTAVKKEFSVKTILYLGKDGFYSREYIDANGIITAKEIYRPDSLKTYYFKTSSDTILAHDVTVNKSSKLVSIEKNSTIKILGHTVDIATTARHVRLRGTDSVYDVFTTYYNDVNYPIHPMTYKYFARSSAEELFSSSPFVTIGYKTVRKNKISYVATATRIVRDPVPSWHFEIPHNKVIIYQNQ